jgi:hypothetical protein
VHRADPQDTIQTCLQAAEEGSQAASVYPSPPECQETDDGPLLFNVDALAEVPSCAHPCGLSLHLPPLQRSGVAFRTRSLLSREMFFGSACLLAWMMKIWPCVVNGLGPRGEGGREAWGVSLV